MIEIINLNKKFGSKEVLTNINLTMKPGEVYGIVGENGAGKTTFFKCIAGLENYSGEIKSNINPLKNQLGYLPTEPYFFSKITGKEFIQLLCNARKVENENIENCNIFDLPLNQYISSYSTGMKKKLVFTAILLQKNSIFILDEPFNGVDIQSNITIIQIIKKLKSLNKTILISSHIFSTLKDTCDEIFYLKNGQIIKKVNHDEFDDLEKEMNSSILKINFEKIFE